MKKLISILISLGLLIQVAPPVAAKPKGDWSNLKALPTGSNNSVAVETTRGALYYGLLDSTDDDGITIQLAGAQEMMPQKITLKRGQVAKVWRARLRFDEDNVKKATLIGTGVGIGVSVAVTLVLASKSEPDVNAGAALIPMIGAGAGAFAGMFWKKRHKKQELVYSI
jgi:hypothetical protein